MILQARAQEHCARRREICGKDLGPQSRLTREHGDCGKTGSRRERCSVLIGAGERRLGV